MYSVIPENVRLGFCFLVVLLLFLDLLKMCLLLTYSKSSARHIKSHFESHITFQVINFISELFVELLKIKAVLQIFRKVIVR